MNFWDSSALVPLLVQEETSSRLMKFYAKERELWVWWGSRAECMSALCRLLREKSLPSLIFDEAVSRLEILVEEWIEIEPSQIVMDQSIRLLRLHPLTAADALQLAAAVVIAEGEPKSVSFVSNDDRLVQAARSEGFRVPKQ